MKIFFFPLFAICIFLLFSSCSNAQQFKLEDIVYSTGDQNLKYKHVLAYIDIEMEGEDTKLLNDQKYMQELTTECIEEFVEAPEELLADLDMHYEAMQMGGGILAKANNQQQTTQNQGNTNKNITSDNSQWTQALSGSVLYQTTTQSRDGLFVQSTQYIHFCANGKFSIYQSSGGGGDFGGIGIESPGQLQYEGSGSWSAIEKGDAAYLQLSLDDLNNALAIKVVNQKIMIQGLGYFGYQQGGAQCY